MSNDILERIRDYMTSGGNFNPELMDHNAVRALILDCGAALQEKDNRLNALTTAYQMVCDWKDFHPPKRNSIVAIAVDNIVNGIDDPKTLARANEFIYPKKP